ncbi:hypothetical protein A2U01_0049330, partial [Trifolium medium]|nr:hypothetical protein [Trifolium medium]
APKSVSSTAPYEDTSFTTNGPDHFDLSFPAVNLNLELNSSTFCPG